ncbi:MAG: MFS transporter, partial [Alphaproteobacteria bacterium]
LAALFAMGIHSTFFGPIKYAILPQHLHDEEVLGGTGLVEAGTYIAILAGTILAGIIPIEAAAVCIIITALVGYVAGRQVPPAPSLLSAQPIDYHIIRSSVALVRGTMHIRRLFLAIMSISLFWAVGSILFIQFPPLVKNVLTAEKAVASLFLAIFSIGIAIGSVAINRLLRGHVSAKYAPASVIGMGLCIVAFHFVCAVWPPAPEGQMLSLQGFIAHPLAIPLSLCLLGVSTFGGMFVVPLYAFLTTTVEKCEAARTVAANNIVNSGAMVVGSLCAIGLSIAGMSVVMQLLLVAFLTLPCAAMAWKLHKACDGPLCH